MGYINPPKDKGGMVSLRVLQTEHKVATAGFFLFFFCYYRVITLFLADAPLVWMKPLNHCIGELQINCHRYQQKVVSYLYFIAHSLTSLKQALCQCVTLENDTM